MRLPAVLIASVVLLSGSINSYAQSSSKSNIGSILGVVAVVAAVTSNPETKMKYDENKEKLIIEKKLYGGTVSKKEEKVKFQEVRIVRSDIVNNKIEVYNTSSYAREIFRIDSDTYAREYGGNKKIILSDLQTGDRLLIYYSGNNTIRLIERYYEPEPDMRRIDKDDKRNGRHDDRDDKNSKPQYQQPDRRDYGHSEMITDIRYIDAKLSEKDVTKNTITIRNESTYKYETLALSQDTQILNEPGSIQHEYISLSSLPSSSQLRIFFDNRGKIYIVEKLDTWGRTTRKAADIVREIKRKYRIP